MSDIVQLSPGRKEIYDRIQRFTALTNNEELRELMWRLGEIVADRDCSEEIVSECKALYGLVGDALKAKLIPLLADHESRISRKRKSRDRFEALRLNKDLSIANQLRDFYFSLSEDDLQAIWNNGENQLPETERDLVRIALRNKLGITAASATSQEVCSQCFLQKSNCVCERGW
jgi:hypothetical protein